MYFISCTLLLLNPLTLTEAVFFHSTAWSPVNTLFHVCVVNVKRAILLFYLLFTSYEKIIIYCLGVRTLMFSLYYKRSYSVGHLRHMKCYKVTLWEMCDQMFIQLGPYYWWSVGMFFCLCVLNIDHFYLIYSQLSSFIKEVNKYFPFLHCSYIRNKYVVIFI